MCRYILVVLGSASSVWHVKVASTLIGGAACKTEQAPQSSAATHSSGGIWLGSDSEIRHSKSDHYLSIKGLGQIHRMVCIDPVIVNL